MGENIDLGDDWGDDPVIIDVDNVDEAHHYIDKDKEKRRLIVTEIIKEKKTETGG